MCATMLKDSETQFCNYPRADDSSFKIFRIDPTFSSALFLSVPLGVVKLLNVTVRSEATNDPGKTPSTNGLAYIEVNGKNYAPQKKGYNVAVFDALSGKLNFNSSLSHLV